MGYPLDICHEKLIRRKPLLAFDETRDFGEWKKEIKEKLTEILGDMPEKCDLNLRIEWEKEHDTFIERRMLFTTEEDIDIPCHLCIPKNIKKPCPVVICLQGHTTGMHVSLGREAYDMDKNGRWVDADFAITAIKAGYAALVMEQRAFGELKSEAMMKFAPDAYTTCAHVAMTAMLVGRTLIGERVWDVKRAVDMLETIDEIDSDRIAIMGNSGGGTATYYAACMEDRIKAVMPSCCVCTFKHSIVWKRHCPCNYLPNIGKFMDMGDMACLIAPRPLILVAGVTDIGFHIDGSYEAFETIKKIYKKAGAEENCTMVVGDEGHRFYSKLAWPVFEEFSKLKQEKSDD